MSKLFIYSNKKGFTILEIAIVIVIIGLILAGVTAGKNLVHVSQLRTVSATMSEQKVMMGTFQLEYDALPGDIADAVSYWGGGTVDGNGDGKISGNDTEEITIWQHYNLAGLMSGNYTGVHEDLGNAMFGKIIPRSKFDSLAGWRVLYETSKQFWTGNNTAAGHNAIRIGGMYLSGNDRVGTRTFNVKDLLYLDTKMDDGRPGSGMFYIFRAECSTTTDADTAEYDLTETSLCMPQYILGW